MNSKTLHSFERDGFCFVPSLLPRKLIEEVSLRMDAVMEGQYETGVPPKRSWDPGDDPLKIRKIDQTHLSDRLMCLE